jgi:cytosine/adenosine deaminase-related metal-dependent hydrolase
MYRVAQALEPEMVHAAALMLYVEMLENGTTSVGEFHYVHHDRSGAPYADVGEMACARGRGGDRRGHRASRSCRCCTRRRISIARRFRSKRRFLCSTDAYLRLVERCAQLARVGIAPHSPARGAALPHSPRSSPRFRAGPVHIHVAEQEREVAGCHRGRAARGPSHGSSSTRDVDGGGVLVHATHLDDGESSGTSRTRARSSGSVRRRRRISAMGLFPLDGGSCRRAGEFGIGSDSQVSVAPGEELRLLEVGQRLLRRTRNGSVPGHLGEALFARALAGEERRWESSAGLEPGARARLRRARRFGSAARGPRNGHAPRRARVRDLAVSDPRGAGRRTDGREGRTTSRSAIARKRSTPRW